MILNPARRTGVTEGVAIIGVEREMFA